MSGLYSAESKSESARVLGEWIAGGRRAPVAVTAASNLSINERIVRFRVHVEQHYRDIDGKPASEVADFRNSFRPQRELYGFTTASGFGPLALNAVRQRMVDEGLARVTTNHRVARIVRMFKWAVENELVSATVLQSLKAVRGLQRGRTAARETEPRSNRCPTPC